MRATSLDNLGVLGALHGRIGIDKSGITLRQIFYKRIGDPEKDKEFLESISPLFHVDSIRIPILVVQGANDPRVKQAEAYQIVEALKAKGLDYEYMLFPDEGHGLARPENRIKFYAKAEEFLARHLGGRYEKAPVEGS